MKITPEQVTIPWVMFGSMLAEDRAALLTCKREIEALHDKITDILHNYRSGLITSPRRPSLLTGSNSLPGDAVADCGGER